METLKQGDIITLENNKEYIVFATAIAPDGKNYVYLMTTVQPVEICFAEQMIAADGNIDLRIISEQNEKIMALNLFRTTYANTTS